MMLNVNRSDLDIESMKFRVLQNLHRRKKMVTIGDLKGRMLGTPVSFDDIMSDLFSNGWIAYQDNQVGLSEEGQKRMNEQSTKEAELIQRLAFEDEFDLALLEFLHNRATMVHMENIPQLLKDQAPRYGNTVHDGPLHQRLFELENKGYVRSPFTQWYGITDTGRAFYHHGITRFNRIHGNHGDHGGGGGGGNSNHTGGGINIGIADKVIINQNSGGINNSGIGETKMSIQNPEDPLIKELAEKQLEDLPKAVNNRQLITKLTIATVIIAIIAIIVAIILN